LHVCWQSLFNGIEDDVPWNERKSENDPDKWIIKLKEYDPSIPYAYSSIVCPGVSLETYPEFKSMHTNELVIVRGTVEHASYGQIVLWDATFEFTQTRIGVGRSAAVGH
jgi:hypothetical protein